MPQQPPPPSEPSKKEPPTTTTTTISFHGSCACARLTYTSTSPPTSTTTCYCATCRKLSGSHSMTFTHIATSALTFTDHVSKSDFEGWPVGGDGFEGVRILRLSTFAERMVCVDCGTHLGMWMRGREGEVAVCVGSVDDDDGLGEGVREGLKAEKAIFVKGVPGWVDVWGLRGIRTCERFDVGFEEEVTRGF